MSEEYQLGDMLWWATGTRGAYGHANLSAIPVRFVSMSATGKRARVRVVGPDGKVLWSTYVKPSSIARRLVPFGELNG